MPSTSACCPDRRYGPCRSPSKQASHFGETIAGMFAQLLAIAHATDAPKSIHIDPQERWFATCALTP